MDRHDEDAVTPMAATSQPGTFCGSTAGHGPLVSLLCTDSPSVKANRTTGSAAKSRLRCSEESGDSVCFLDESDAAGLPDRLPDRLPSPDATGHRSNRVQRNSHRPRTPFGLNRPAGAEVQWRPSTQAVLLPNVASVASPAAPSTPIATLTNNFNASLASKASSLGRYSVRSSSAHVDGVRLSTESDAGKNKEGSDERCDNIVVYSAATSVSETEPLGSRGHVPLLHAQPAPAATKRKGRFMRNASEILISQRDDSNPSARRESFSPTLMGSALGLIDSEFD